MQTLIIYDDLGQIFSQISDNYLLPQGEVQFLELEIPIGKQIIGVDVSITPNVAILEDIPLTETEVTTERITNAEDMINALMMM